MEIFFLKKMHVQVVHGIQEYRHIQTDSEHEVVEGLFVEVVEGKFH